MFSIGLLYSLELDNSSMIYSEDNLGHRPSLCVNGVPWHYYNKFIKLSVTYNNRNCVDSSRVNSDTECYLRCEGSQNCIFTSKNNS